MLLPGLYEQVINTALNCELVEIPEARKSVARTTAGASLPRSALPTRS